MVIVSLFSAYYYDWLCFSSVLTKWNTPLLSIFNYDLSCKSCLTFQCSPWPLKSTQHKFQVSFAGTPLTCSCNPDKNNQIVLLYYMVIVSLFSAYYYDWLCFSSVLTKWNTPLLSIFNYAQLVLKKIIFFIFKIICIIPGQASYPLYAIRQKGKIKKINHKR